MLTDTAWIFLLRKNLMAIVTAKALHTHLKLLEKAAELKGRIPTSSNPRALEEGLSEMSRLLSTDGLYSKISHTVPP
jgi:hypothetical protein